MARAQLIAVCSLLLTLCIMFAEPASAQLSTNFYSASCPNVETIVRTAVTAKFKQTFVTVPATLRLFFHDCFVTGCDASTLVALPGGNAEKDHDDNLSLAGDGFDTVIKAKAAVEVVCKNKVSCADVLALATRDVVVLAGGPTYAVELGRRDGLSSSASSVTGKLPKPTFNLNQLNAMFSANGLNQVDMIALSGGGHTVGFSHCNRVAPRIYNFAPGTPVDPTLNPAYAKDLQGQCPRNVDPSIAINMDPNTPRRFDNVYYQNLQQGKGLFTSDQILFTDTRSRAIVNTWASNSAAFNQAFVTAMTKLGRLGVKTGTSGKIRTFCDVL